MRTPSDDASELDWLLFKQSGVVAWRQAADLLGPARVRRLVATGRWQRPYLRFSAFQTRHRPAEVAEQIRRALLAAGWPG